MSGIETWNRFARKAARNFRACRGVIRSPPGPLPPDQTALDSCLNHLSPNEQQHLYRYILATCLLMDFPRPDWLISRLENMNYWPFSLKELLVCPWLNVSLLVQSGEEGDCVRLLCGLREKGSGQIVFFANQQDFFDSAGREAIRMIWRHYPLVDLSRHDFLILPLFAPASPLSGSSLGLAVALALYFLQCHLTWPRGLYATGRLDDAFAIHLVCGLKEKFAVVHRESPLLFLYPAASRQQDLPESCCSVSDFTETLEYVRWFQEGVHGDFHFYRSCLTDENRFFANVDNLPVPVLQKAISEQNLPFTTDDIKELNLWRRTVKAFRKLSRNVESGLVFQQLVTEKLFNEIISLSDDHAYWAFFWSTSCVALANHSGDPVMADNWSEQAVSLQNVVDPEEFAGFIIKAEVINKRHNRYIFRKDLPERFKRAFRQCAGSRAGRYVCASFEGTIAQNFAFCGPENLTAVNYHIDRALQQFGPKHGMEQKRQYCYRVYACLDGSETRQAEAALCSYLEIGENNSIVEMFQETKGRIGFHFKPLAENDRPFCWAVLIRFLADTVNREETAEIWPVCRVMLKEITAGSMHCHPWQLTLYNLGRIAVQAGEKKKARQCWHRAKELCLRIGRTTRPMALLPLSMMQEHYMIVDRAEAVSLLAEIENQPKMFCSEHFKPLFGKPAQAALQMVTENPGRFFPFNYR